MSRNGDDTPQLRAPQEATRGLEVNMTGFALSEELEERAGKLISEHGRLRHLERDWRVAYLYDYGDPPRNGKACAWGKARLVPTWAKALTPYDAAVSILHDVWQVLSERQRDALLLHELLHLGENPDSGKLEVVPHDVEEFGYVAATFGQWRSSLEAFAEQLSMGLDGTRPLRDLATRTGTSITIEHDGKSATIEPDGPDAQA